MASGGKRPGAGRPFLDDPRDKKFRFLCDHSSQTPRLKIAALEDGIKIGKIVDEAVNDVTRRWLQGEDLSELK